MLAYCDRPLAMPAMKILGTNFAQRRIGAYCRKKIMKKTKLALRKSPLRDLYRNMSIKVKKDAD
jgi:hypothetical protein